MRDAGGLKQALMGQHLIKTDASEVICNVTTVMTIREINVYHTYMRTGVVDGAYTVDIILDDEGDFVDGESGSVESGVFTAEERIATMLERDYRERMPHKIVEGVLQTGISQRSARCGILWFLQEPRR